MKNTYTIHEISKIFDLPKSKLRYWDSEGLINLARNEQNNYREYNVTTMYEVMDVLSYRALNIPIKDVKHLLSASPEELEVTLVQKEQDVQHQIDALLEVQSALQKKKQHLAIYEELLAYPYAPSQPDASIIIPFQVIDTSYWNYCVKDSYPYSIVYNAMTGSFEYGLSFESSKPVNDVLWENTSSTNQYVQFLLKINYNDYQDHNLQEHLDYLHQQGKKTGTIIARLLFSANDPIRYDYYRAWVEICR